MRISVPESGLVRLPQDVSFDDLTASRLVGDPSWDADEPDVLVLPFDVEPSATEQQAIRRRLLTSDATEETQVASLLQARTALANDTTTYGKILRLLVNDRLREARES